jgi:hypothetical protein
MVEEVIMGNSIVIKLGEKAKALSGFWDYFSKLPYIEENDSTQKRIRENEIPLWGEDLEAATRVDKRFDKHFPRVIQLAVWAMNPEGGEYGPHKIGCDCEEDIFNLRKQLSATLEGLFKKVAKEIIGDDDATIEKEQIMSHLVRMVALYHDIGKRIAKARHPDEGYFYLKNVIDEKTKKDIKEYICDFEIKPPIKSESEKKIKEKLASEIWDVFLMVIRYHDCPGVLGTGEASLGLLVDSLSYHTTSINKQELILILMGFTNIVDSSASIGQKGPKLGETGGMNKEIIKNILDDLALFRYVLKEKASQNLGYLRFNKDDPDRFKYVDKMKLEEEIFRVEKAEYRTVGRIERLLKERASEDLKKQVGKDVIREAMVGALGHTNIQEFCRRLAAVVKLEYMLDFIGWVVKYPEKIWDTIVNGEHMKKLPEVSKINVEKKGDDDKRDIRKARELAKALLEHTAHSALYTLMGNILLKAIQQEFDSWGGREYGLDQEELEKKVESFFKTRAKDIPYEELKYSEDAIELVWIPGEYQSKEPEEKLNFQEITAVLTCLGHYFARGDDIIVALNDQKEEIKKKYKECFDDAANANEKDTWRKRISLEIDELEHLAVTFKNFFSQYEPVIPIEKEVDLKQWFSDTDLAKHYLRIEPKFMATHVIALLWQIVQKYPPQHKHPMSEPSRMGVSMIRLTKPVEFAEKIVPLIVASGMPSHAYTWIEEEITIWHFC